MEEVNQLRLEQIKKDRRAAEAKSQLAKGKILALYRKSVIGKAGVIARGGERTKARRLASRTLTVPTSAGSDTRKNRKAAVENLHAGP